MNVFILEKNNKGEIDWKKSAKSHDNTRMKMILEHAQLLSTALNEIAGKRVAPYRSFNPKHPCCLWTKQTRKNFFSLFYFTQELLNVYHQRFGNKKHKVEEVLKEIEHLTHKPFFNKLQGNKLTNPALAMPDCYKSDDVVESYRNYWVSKPTMVYPINEIPEWFKERRKTPFKVKVPQNKKLLEVRVKR